MVANRYAAPDIDGIRAFWTPGELAGVRKTHAKFNISPGQKVPIIVREPGGDFATILARWALVPPTWSSRRNLPDYMFQVESESLGTRQWAQIAQTSRCIIPALGWYEWEGERRKSPSGELLNQPFFHQGADGGVLAIAGLWATCERERSQPVISCAMLTRSAAPTVLQVHHRMPVILPMHYILEWLDPTTSLQMVKALTVGVRHDFACYPVSKEVNNPTNDYAGLMKPLS